MNIEITIPPSLTAVAPTLRGQSGVATTCLLSNAAEIVYRIEVPSAHRRSRRTAAIKKADSYGDTACTAFDLVKLARLAPDERVVLFLPAA